jgi:hypothetical protein
LPSALRDSSFNLFCCFPFLIPHSSFPFAPSAQFPSHQSKFQLGFRLTNGFVGIQADNRLETGKRCAARLLHSWRKVLLDADLMLYGVEPRVLNQAVARNRKRFPADFMFQVSAREYDALTSQIVISDKNDARGAPALRSQIVISKKGRGGRRYRHYAFTEQGVAMLSSVLRSARAVEVNIAIMRTFVQLRRLMDTNRDLARKIEALEKKYDEQFAVVFEAIKQLITPPEPPRRRIGSLLWSAATHRESFRFSPSNSPYS